MLGGRPLVWVWGWGWAWRTCRNQAQEAPGDEGWRTGGPLPSTPRPSKGSPAARGPSTAYCPVKRLDTRCLWPHALGLQQALLSGLHSERFRCLRRSAAGHQAGLSHAVRGELRHGGPPARTKAEGRRATPQRPRWGPWAGRTCWCRPRRSVRPPRCCSSPCSAPSRCLLKCGRGRLGLKSELSMLTGANMMEALVTGPVGPGGRSGGPGSRRSSDCRPSSRAPPPPLARPASRRLPSGWAADEATRLPSGLALRPRPHALGLPPVPPFRVTVLMHCLLWTSQRRTVSSCEPDSSTLPSVDTDRQVTWLLGPRARTRRRE